MVVSKEIYEKQYYKELLVDKENFILLEDLNNHSACAKKIDSVLKNELAYEEIGSKAHQLSLGINNYNEFINSYITAFRLALKK